MKQEQEQVKENQFFGHLVSMAVGCWSGGSALEIHWLESTGMVLIALLFCWVVVMLLKGELS